MQNGGCHPVDGCQDGTPFDGRGLPVPRRERRLQGRQRHHLPALRDQKFNGVKVGDHRHDPRGHALDRLAGGHPGRDFLDEADTVNALVPAQEEGRRDDRRAGPRGRVPERRSTTTAPGSRARSSTSSTGRATRSTCSSPATPTRPTTASSTAGRSPAPTSTAGMITDIDMKLEPRDQGASPSISVNNRLVTRDVDPDPGADRARSTTGARSPTRSRNRGGRRGHGRHPRGRPTARASRRSATSDRRCPAVGHRRRPGGAVRVHEPGRHPRRPDLRQPDRRRGPGEVTYGEVVHGPAVPEHAW